MTPETVKALIKRITYKSGWNLVLHVYDRCFDLQWTFTEREAHDPFVTNFQFGRRWSLPWHCCESEVLHTALLAAITAEEHECREHFMLDGRAVFGPHHRVEALLALADAVETRTTKPITPAPPPTHQRICCMCEGKCDRCGTPIKLGDPVGVCKCGSCKNLDRLKEVLHGV